MATSKPVSTISYNSEDFLKEKLQDLLDSEIISFYSYIVHKADTDDKKEHIHLRLVLNKCLDLVKLQKEFIEFVPASDKPLKCMLFRPSSESDWILYCEHNEMYLTCKNLHRNIEYTYNDFVVSDSDEFQLQYNASIEYLHSVLARDYITEKEIKSGVPLHELAYDGLITSKNAFRMKQFKDIYSKKINDSKYDDLCKREKELDELISSLRSREQKYTKAVDFYEQYKDNPFVTLL